MIYTFDNVMREYMDYSDMATIHAIAEASDHNQEQMLTALTSKLYDLIVAKADKVDYSTISRSRGDITKIDHYSELMECLDTIRGIVVAYKQDTHPVDVVTTAVDNLKSRVDSFKKAFVINSPLMIMTYNNIGLAIVDSVSFLIATCIEFIKEPNTNSFQMALDTVAYNKTEHNLLFNNLSKFNDSCKSGEFNEASVVMLKKTQIKKEAAEFMPKEDEPFLSNPDIENDPEAIDVDPDSVVLHDEDIREGVVFDVVYGTSRVLLFIAKLLIPMIRDLVYFYYSNKQKISDYYAVQADLLEMNAYRLQYNTNIDEKERKKIYDKQMKTVAKWRGISNKFNVDYSKSKRDAEKMANDEAKKYVADDLDNPSNQSEDQSSDDSPLF